MAPLFQSGVTEAEYFGLCDELAPAFAALPGLVSKSWLADSTSNIYGGVNVWENQQAMEEFKATELFKTVATHPNLEDISARDFGVIDGPSRVTRGHASAVV